MSGGVDSSTAAASLLRAGYRVIGVTMLLWTEADVRCPAPTLDQRGTPDSVARAEGVARKLGIPLHVIDLRQEFRQHVVDYLVAEYGRGRTPNPCLACNRSVKFGRLLEIARGLGGDAFATGHYVRSVYREGAWHLLRGLDRRKDQSYFLYMLGQAELSQVLFPLGDRTKDEVRRLASAWGLPTAAQAESQEICFISDNDYRRFLQHMAPDLVRPGLILDAAGKEIGRHRGLPFYTIGQRKGLGIAAREPLYVIALDVERNALIAGPARELGGRRAMIEQVSYVSGRVPPASLHATAKIRYRAIETPVEVVPTGDTAAVAHFARPLRDIAPGQAIVFYEDEEVLGGGIISSSSREG